MAGKTRIVNCLFIKVDNTGSESKMLVTIVIQSALVRLTDQRCLGDSLVAITKTESRMVLKQWRQEHQRGWLLVLHHQQSTNLTTSQGWSCIVKLDYWCLIMIPSKNNQLVKPLLGSLTSHLYTMVVINLMCIGFVMVTNSHGLIDRKKSDALVLATGFNNCFCGLRLVTSEDRSVALPWSCFTAGSRWIPHRTSGTFGDPRPNSRKIRQNRASKPYDSRVAVQNNLILTAEFLWPNKWSTTCLTVPNLPWPCLKQQLDLEKPIILGAGFLWKWTKRWWKPHPTVGN